MKQVFKNRYLKGFKFSSSQELSTFLGNQGTGNSLTIKDTFGDNYYCYVCYHSLTKEKQFVLSFSSDENEEDLNVLFWDEHKIFILDTGKNIYLIDDNLNIKSSFEVTTPLIGLYLINVDSLLLLEEAFMRVVDHNGGILKREVFDLIEDFSVKDNYLFIQTSEESKTFELT